MCASRTYLYISLIVLVLYNSVLRTYERKLPICQGDTVWVLQITKIRDVKENLEKLTCVVSNSVSLCEARVFF